MIRVLGPLAVDGAVLPKRRQERLLLARLALEPDTTVGTDELVDLVWPASHQDRRPQLRVLVSRLRRHLEVWPVDADLVSEPAGYRLAARTDQVDVCRLRSLLDAPSDEVLELCGGDPVAEFDELLGHPVRTRLASLVPRALDRWAEGALGAGEPEKVVLELTARAGPQAGGAGAADERLLAHLLVALYRCGRGVEALERIHQHRTVLAERGLVPGPELTAVEVAILTHDGSLGPAPGPVAGPPTAWGSEVRELDGVRTGVDAVLGTDAVSSLEVEAAERARAEGRHAEAARLLARAVARGVDAAVEHQLVVDLAESRWRAGEPGAELLFAEAQRRARAEGDREAVVEVALRWREVGWHGPCRARPDTAVYDAALDALGPDDPRRAVVLADLAGLSLHTGLGDRRTAWFDEALGLARRVGDDATLRRVLANALVLDDPDQLERRLALAAELVERATRADDVQARHFGHRILLLAHLETGDADALDHHLAELEATAEAIGEPAFTWAAAGWRAPVLLHRGRIAEAEGAAREAMVVGSAGAVAESRLLWLFSGQIAEIRRLQGRIDELASLASEAGDGDGDQAPQAPWRAARVMFEARLGDATSARTALADLLADRLPFNRGVAWGVEVLCAIEAVEAIADAAAARQLGEALLDRSDRFATTGAAGCGPVALLLGRAAVVAGDRSAAEAHLADAAARARAAQAPVYQAEALARLAGVVAGSGSAADRRRAAGLADEARALARPHGAGLVTGLVAALPAVVDGQR